MKLKNYIKADNILPEMEASSKEEAITELVDLLVSNGELADRDRALEDIWRREKLMSTGLQHGLATPHTKTRLVDTLKVAIGLKKEGLDFAALDGELSRIFIMVFSPQNVRGPHVQFLAEIAGLLNDFEAREKLLAMESSEDIHSFFTG